MKDHRDIEISRLREEIARLLADAHEAAEETRVESRRVERVHRDELAAARSAHHGEISDLAQMHDVDTQDWRAALSSRDIIGQAKGIIMVTMRCDSDRAFELLRSQSQAQNRKLVDVATEVAERASRIARPD